MSDLEEPRESALFEAKKARIGYLIQDAVVEDLHELFVTGNYHEVDLALCKVARRASLSKAASSAL